MKYDPDRHHRRSIRLKGYDYSQAGVYFVSVCTQNRECLFGAIVGGEMVLNHAGRMVETVWDRLARRFPDIELDESIILPNHIHGIITIVGAPLVGAQSVDAQSVDVQARRAGTRPAPTRLGDVVGAFKSITTHRYIVGVRQHGWQPFPRRLWQRNYYEHIVRDDNELTNIRGYITGNPGQWELDRENPLPREMRCDHSS